MDLVYLDKSNQIFKDYKFENEEDIIGKFFSYYF